MQKLKSNRKLKNAISKLMFMLLICLTAISIMHSTSVHAASSKSNAVDGSGVTDMNGTDSGTGSNRGGLYYAGSVFRSGFLFMIVDNDGKPMKYKDFIDSKTAEDYGLEEWDAVTFRIVQPQLKFDLENTHIESYVTHFGEVNSFSGHVYEDAPAPIKDNGPNWSGNSAELEQWLFKQVPLNGKTIDNWQFIVLKELSEQSPELAGKVLKDLMTDEEVNLAIEPITIHAGYDWTEWSEEDWNTNAAVHSDKGDIDYDYYSNKENNFWRGKPFILTNTVNLGKEGIISGDNRILRVCSTGMYSATLIHRIGDALGRPVDDTGGKNRTWVNETLPFCIRLESDQLGITAVGNGSPERLPYSTIGNQNLGYALVLFRAELKQAKIHTFAIDVSPNPNDHYKSETPKSEKHTDGECHIIKLYYKYKKNSVTYKTEPVACYETNDTTNIIQVMDEKVQTGYELKGWATHTNEKVPNITTEYKTTFKENENIGFSYLNRWVPKIIAGSIQKGTSEGTVTLSDNEHYIYLLYCKTEEEPEPEYSDSNWEIPESYLTKSAYFSSAKPTEKYKFSFIIVSLDGYFFCLKTGHSCWMPCSG